MKFGAHIYLWLPRWSDAATPRCARARELGLDWLELALGDEVVFDPVTTRRAAVAAGLELVVSPGGVWPAECDLSLADPALRRKGLAWHTRAVELAAAVGAVAYTGALYGHPGTVARRLPTAEEYQRSAEGLHALAERAAALGVKVCLEPMSHFRTHLVNRPEQLMALLARADHPNLFALLDTYHLVTEIRDYPAAVRTCAPRLWGLHACENDRGAPGPGPGPRNAPAPAPGVGLVPWPATFAALHEVGFDGYVGLESYRSGPGGFAPQRGLFHDPCPDGDAFVRQALGFLRGLVQSSSTRGETTTEVAEDTEQNPG